MNTKRATLKNNATHSKLINAVIRQLGGIESIEDITKHSMEGGFDGFCTYSETHTFAIRNRKYIIALLEEQAEEFRIEVISMVSDLHFFSNHKMDNEDRKELYRYLGGAKCESSTITNIMAWYAAEEVANMFNND